MCSERGPQHNGFPVSLRPHQGVDTSPARHGAGTIGVTHRYGTATYPHRVTTTRPLPYLSKQRLPPTAYRSLKGTMIYPPGLPGIQLTGPLVPSMIPLPLSVPQQMGAS